MADLFYYGQTDYIYQLNVMNNRLNAAGSPINPRFTTFGGSWTVPDMRPNKWQPSNYQSFAVSVEFNDTANLDYPPGAGLYAYTLTMSAFTSSGAGGGGLPVQLNFGDTLSYRRGNSASTWTGWKRLASYDDQIATFGSPTAKNTILVVGGDGSTNGASILVQNGGGTVIAMGNKSSIIGGAYDSAPMIYAPYNIDCNVGATFGGIVQLKGGQECIRLIDNAAFVSFWNSPITSRTGYIQAVSGATLEVAADTGHVLKFTTNGSPKVLIDLDGNQYPTFNGTQYLGLPSNKYRAIFADTGAIQTSDARKKTKVKKLTTAEVAAAKEMFAELGTYQWLEAVEEKGDKARKHIGLTVQQAITIMEKNGLKPFEYAFICHDIWENKYEKQHINAGEKTTKIEIYKRQKVNEVTVEKPVIEIVDGKAIIEIKPVTEHVQVFDDHPLFDTNGQPVLDPDGKQVIYRVPVMEDYEVPSEVDAEPIYADVLVQKAGDCYAFRYDQLALFLIAGATVSVSA